MFVLFVRCTTEQEKVKTVRLVNISLARVPFKTMGKL